MADQARGGHGATIRTLSVPAERHAAHDDFLPARRNTSSRRRPPTLSLLSASTICAGFSPTGATGRAIGSRATAAIPSAAGSPTRRRRHLRPARIRDAVFQGPARLRCDGAAACVLDNQSIFKEWFFIDKANPNVIHDLTDGHRSCADAAVDVRPPVPARRQQGRTVAGDLVPGKQRQYRDRQGELFPAQGRTADADQEGPAGSGPALLQTAELIGRPLPRIRPPALFARAFSCIIIDLWRTRRRNAIGRAASKRLDGNHDRQIRRPGAAACGAGRSAQVPRDRRGHRRDRGDRRRRPASGDGRALRAQPAASRCRRSCCSARSKVAPTIIASRSMCARRRCSTKASGSSWCSPTASTAASSPSRSAAHRGAGAGA